MALASGAAGAFALSRRSVADALPGVAIAISLVPPLCVVGICLSQGEVDAAGGAALLFLTNLVAILVAGGGLLALMGYGAVARRGVKPEHRRKAALVTGVALLAILVPLVYSSLRLAQDSLLESTARAETQQWLAGTAYELVEVTANGQDLEDHHRRVGPAAAHLDAREARSPRHDRGSSWPSARWPRSTSQVTAPLPRRSCRRRRGIISSGRCGPGRRWSTMTVTLQSERRCRHARADSHDGPLMLRWGATDDP